jgi:beta-N-acetylhexosaminidase
LIGHRAAAVAGAIVLLAGCTSGAHRSGAPAPTTTVGRPGPTTTAAATTTPATTSTTGTCTNGSVIASWPVARRAAQLIVVPVLAANPAAVEVAVSAQAGGVLILGSVPSSATLRSDLSATRSGGGVPLMVMTDEEGGEVQRLLPDVSSLPWPRQMASTMTAGQVKDLAESLGRQMKGLGVDVDLAPVLDLDGGPELSASDPDGPRSFSTVASVAGTYGSAFVQGLAAAGVLAVVKHFPGLGGASGNTDYGPAATRPLSSLRASGLLPFQQSIGAGARAVMVANATVPGLTAEPASVSSAVITGLLRDQLHFGGLVMTDSLSAGALRQAGYSPISASVAAIEAGADMVLFGSTLSAADTAALAPGPLSAETGGIVDAITHAVQTGALPAARLNQAVADVIAAKGLNLCGG